MTTRNPAAQRTAATTTAQRLAAQTTAPQTMEPQTSAHPQPDPRTQPKQAGPVSGRAALGGIAAASPLFAMLGDSADGIVCGVDGVCAVPENPAAP
ncbi:hypothetical protein BH09ACT6_BH09ACT6_27160 [soil metagenome]